MISLRTRDQKRREWARQYRLRLSFERAFTRRVTAEFNTVAREAARQNVEKAVTDHRMRLTRLLTRFYTGTLAVFARRTLDAVGKSKRSVSQHKNTEQEVEAAIQAYIQTNALDKATAISQTTGKRIRKAIAAGVAEGANPRQIARYITAAAGGNIGRFRAEVIARTETHAASQAGSLAAAESLDIVETKEWVSVEDDRTREDHSEANGQIVNLKDKFTVGGVSLSFPGDPSGPAEQVINCRCVIVYGVHQ